MAVSGADQLDFAVTVPRHLVHRQSVAEVFLTDGLATGEPGHFLVAAQWPRHHLVFRPNQGRFNCLLLAETLRQAAIYLAHTQYRVPVGHHFVMEEISVDANIAVSHTGDCPADVVAEVAISCCRFVDDALVEFRPNVTFWNGSRVLGTARGTARVFEPRVYQTIRSSSTQPVTPNSSEESLGLVRPALIGEPGPRNVALLTSDSPTSWRLHVDTSHPVYFDHPCDHVPGMLIIASMLQAARLVRAAPDAPIAGFSARFWKFAELKPAVVIDAADKAASVGVDLRQAGHHIAAGEIRFSDGHPDAR